MFESSDDRAPHGALKCEISASRRLRSIRTIVLIDRLRPLSVFQGGVLEAFPARA
jgi:hypothetical protein